MWELWRQPWRWPSASNARSIENARAASVECSRRLVERAEVEHYLAGLHGGAPDRSGRAGRARDLRPGGVPAVLG